MTAVPVTIAGVKRGFSAGSVLALPVGAYGVAFGVLAAQASLAIAEAIAMSVFIYSGSAQLAVVNALTTGSAGLGAVVATVLLLNARYLLFGAALRPWLGAAPALPTYLGLFFMGDGNWMLTMKAHDEGEQDGGYLIGSGIAMVAPWVGGTVVGFYAGALIPNPATLGLDFLLVAFAAAMAAGMVKARGDLAPVALAAVVSIGAATVTTGGWPVVAAGLAGLLYAAFKR
jgi:predicted branched-subunit amino acid permease